MSDEKEQRGADATVQADAPAHERSQPNYLAVFIALAALTLLEVAVTYTPLPRLPVLLPLALLKAALVVLFYMHLRFDNRVFAVLFVMGLVMGAILIISLALMFGPPLFGVKQ